MADIKIPAGFLDLEKQEIGGRPITTWIGDDSREEVYGVFNGGGAKGKAKNK